MYYLYVHTVPNGKIYIGMSEDPINRWANGDGYSDNIPFYYDIQLFGWNNIKHEIIKTFCDKDECHLYEKFYISFMDSENPMIGYNQTQYKKDFMRLYNEKLGYHPNNPRDPKPRNIFEEYHKSYDAGLFLINQWILSEKERNMVKDSLLNGLSFIEISEKYNISVRQAKNIIYRSQAIILHHI